MKSLIVAAVLAALGFAKEGQAQDKITFNLTNSTGRTISPNATFTTCSPSGSSCTVPSSIPNGSTGTIVHQAVNGATVGPLLIARYQYSSGGTSFSCQLTVRVTKSNSNPAVCTGSTASFLKTGGTASAPTCTPNPPTLTSFDDTNCIYVYAATMQ